MKLFKERGSKFFRGLDRYFGIFILFFLSIFTRKKNFPKNISTIGVMKLAGIGDVVLLSGTINALRKKYPEKKIIFFSGKANSEVASFLPVDKVVTLSVFSPLQTIKALRKEKLSILVDCEAWSRISAVFSFFSQAKYKVGFQSHKQYKHFGFDRVEKHLLSRHEVDNFFALFAGFSLDKPFFSFPDKKNNKKENILVIHLCPGGSRSEEKKWPISHWRRFLLQVSSLPIEIYATGSKKDDFYIQRVCEGFSVHNKAGRLSLAQTLSLLQSCKAVVSVDTGIMHLSGALGVTTLGLHGPTDPFRWGAVGSKVIAITPKKKHPACIQFGFEKVCKSCLCMDQIDPDEVFQKFLEVFTR